MSKDWHEQPETYFRGTWGERHPFNTPGPFYGADTDTCWDGPVYAPACLLCDKWGQGFVWRQPMTDSETLALRVGASSDPFSGFGWDGNDHWTPEAVRAWWAARVERAPAVSQLILELTEYRKGTDDPLPGSIARQYGEYLQAGLEPDLRRYIYFLEVGRYPVTGASLPAL